VEQWLQNLPVADRAKIAAILLEIEEVGFDALGCDFRQVQSKLWELKIRSASGGFRIFYVAIIGPEMVLLHAIRKGKQKIPKKDLELALKRKEWRISSMSKTRHKAFSGFLKKQQTDPEFRILFDVQCVKLHIARLVKTARTQRGWTQAELAQRVGTTQSVIARLESASDEREPSLHLLGRLASALGFQLALSFERMKKTPPRRCVVNCDNLTTY